MIKCAFVIGRFQGVMEIVVFPKVMERSICFVKENVVLIKGRAMFL